MIDNIAAPVSVTLGITVIGTNDAPTWAGNPISGANATEDSAYSGNLAASVSDVDAGAILSFSKVGGPAWLSVAPNGSLSGMPTNSDVGSNSFTVSVSDGIAAPVETALNITVDNTNDAPVWAANPIGGAAATEDGAYTGSLAGIATDMDAGANLTYAKVSGPSWLSVGSNGALSGTPANSDVGANSSTGTVPNTWLRLVRSGATITAYKSTNGTSWTSVGSTTNTTFASTCYIGLAVGSGSDTTLNTSQFSNVSVTP